MVAWDALRFCRLSVYTKRFQAVDFDAVVSAYLSPPGAKAPVEGDLGAGAVVEQPVRHAGRHHPSSAAFPCRCWRTAVRDLVAMDTGGAASSGSCGPATSWSRSVPGGDFRTM